LKLDSLQNLIAYFSKCSATELWASSWPSYRECEGQAIMLWCILGRKKSRHNAHNKYMHPPSESLQGNHDWQTAQSR